MARYPTLKEIELLTAQAIEIFKSIMPPIAKPYPRVYTATARTFTEMRARLAIGVGCKHTEEPEDSIMEYIHGDKGYVILIRQNLLPDKNIEHFNVMLWHELGHFYAINSEETNLHRYSNPGVVDDSRILEFGRSGPVLGMSVERLKQEGYWFWQEFIAEAISKHVYFKNLSRTLNYHTAQIDWHPDAWGHIVDKLLYLLDSTFLYHTYTIDEYALAHYFANLLMDDFIKLYVQAAADGKLKVYNNDPSNPHQGNAASSIDYPSEPIEPTCISDIDVEEQHEHMWKMKAILEQQVVKGTFWMIDEEFLHNIGRCIGEMMFTKLIVMNRNEK